VRNLVNKLKQHRQKILYILVNLSISGVGFAKSFMYLKYLNFYELGLITIIQTIMLFISMLQLGLLNGGYRIFSLGKKEDNRQTNNTIFTYIVLMLVVLIVGSLLVNVLYPIDIYIVLLGIITGAVALCANWLTNVLIALARLKELNRLNTITNLLTLVTLPLIVYWGFYGAISTLIIQQLAFICLVLLLYKDTRPDKIEFNLSFIKWILTFGFIPFLTGILYYVNIQIERWSIKFWLGTDTLGMFYLAIVYTTLFNMVPSSLNNLFFPSTMQAFTNKDFTAVKKGLRNYNLLLWAYSIGTVIITALFIEYFVLLLFPKHIIGIKYVYAILPGLIAIALSGPIGLLFNASVILRPMLWAYMVGTLITIISIAVLVNLKQFTLFNMAIVESAFGVFVGIFFFVAYQTLKKKLWNQANEPSL